MSTIKVNVNGAIVEMDKEEVSKAIETGEININSEELVTYKKDEFETFRTNLANDEYKKGKTAGVEMTIKDARDKYELDFEGKTFDNFADAFKSKILGEAKVEPSKKIQELEQDNKKLLSNYQQLESDFSSFKTGITEKETRTKKDNTLLGFIPQTGLKVDRDITLMALKTKAGLDLDFDESGNSIVTMNGQVVKDEKTLQPVNPESYITDRLTALDLIEKNTDGRGETDNTGGGTVSGYDKFVKEMANNNVEEGSQDFSIEMSKRIKDGTLKL